MPDAPDATQPPRRGPNNEAIAANVRRILDRDDISAAELGRRIGMSGANITRILDNRVNINVETLTKIAEALDVKAGELLPEGHSCAAGGLT